MRQTLVCRKKEQNPLICDSDRGCQKNPKILRTSYMEAPYSKCHQSLTEVNIQNKIHKMSLQYQSIAVLVTQSTQEQQQSAKHCRRCRTCDTSLPSTAPLNFWIYDPPQLSRCTVMSHVFLLAKSRHNGFTLHFWGQMAVPVLFYVPW